MNREARCLLRAHRYGALCTLSKKLDGAPFGSIAPYLVDHDGSLIIHISELAEHTKNLEHDARVSLITHNQNDPHIQMQGRVTLNGYAHRLPDRQHAQYLRHFPEAQELVKLDFYFYRITPIAIRYIAGPGRVHWIDMKDYAATQAQAFAKHEMESIDWINHQAELGALLDQHGINAPEAKVFALDCDGINVRCGEQIFRLDFTEALADPRHTESLDSLKFRMPQV